MQQVQPAFIMFAQQSQQAWIIAQHSLSPLVQVKQTPMSIASHLHIPIIMLQQQTIIPFIIIQQLHIPPAIIVHRFWSIPADVCSSQTQLIFIPPLDFSNVILQRGTIIILGAAGVVADAPVIPMPGMPIRFRSVIMVAIVQVLSLTLNRHSNSADPSNLLRF
ncbi:MAG TPA: hypothetical protein VHS97_22365 [Isosphaeraceae bacterium]|nr:hypothetical protein [Isosphaeraceae bacterium]